jgi:glycine/D-amino acid oxidase-like deaminating enzyme
LPDYEMVVIGSGFAGSTATLSFLEAAEKAGKAGRVALIEAGKRGTWPGGSRWTRPFLRLDRDNTLLSDRAERVEQNLSDLDYWRKLEDEVPDTVEFMEDHGVKLIHYDEENAALDFEEQHFAHPSSGARTTGSWSTRIENASTTRAKTTSSPPPSPSPTTPGVTRTRSRTSSSTRP